tara:strand:- start:891 stop:1247 length:357 start_codon:yes stop_codon:yes gene_type:complete
MWEEYIIPLIVIAFVAGIVIGINLTMLCSQRLSNTNSNNNPITAYAPRNIQHQHPIQHHPQQHGTAPMQYPQGFHQHPNYVSSDMTTTELTANDFNRYNKGIKNGRRRSNNNGGLNYG